MDHPYLIAFALIKEKGKNAMPIGGKSLKSKISKGEFPKEEAEKVALELLIRLIERSENNPIQRQAGKNSILIVLISMEQMQSKIPELKAEWLTAGDNDVFISKLSQICQEIWQMTYVKHEGLKILSIN